MQIHRSLHQYTDQVLKNKMRQSHKGDTYFLTTVPGKTQCGKTSAADLRVFIVSSIFLSTTRVPNPVHPIEKISADR